MDVVLVGVGGIGGLQTGSSRAYERLGKFRVRREFMFTRPLSLFTALTIAAAGPAAPARPLAGRGVEPVPPKVASVFGDAAEVLSPSDIHINGWLGARIDANESKRLLVVDTEPLLAGYHKRPGSHPWIGEHVGKWMHAATLAWAYTGDPRLQDKLDRVAAELIACQEPDGYLGTYVPDKRFGLYPGADWDVWSHKYNLIGLLTYYQYTGNKAALAACRKMGDLLIATFPAKKSILAAGTHMGMAATSVLEPIVLLYRATGDERYLEFARYIVKSWDEPNGPKIMASLLTTKRVDKTANGKAYEMLSNLVGLCELARATGDRELLQAGAATPGRTSSRTACTSRAPRATASISRTTTSCRTRRTATSARRASRRPGSS